MARDNRVVARPQTIKGRLANLRETRIFVQGWFFNLAFPGQSDSTTTWKFCEHP